MTAAATAAAVAAMVAAVTVAVMAVLMAVALTMTSVTTAAAVVAMVVAEAAATATVMTAAATVGVKRQQLTSGGTVEGGRWTRAQRRVTMNNKSAWPMMRAGTKRVARAMATVKRVVGEQLRQW
jgi:hypothetical protein